MKMRKWIISVLAVLLVIALAGCATKEEKAKPKKAPEPLVINTKDKKKDYNLTYDNLAIPEIHTQSDSDSSDADTSNPVHTESSKEEANISYDVAIPEVHIRKKK